MAIGFVALAAEQRWADERDFSDTLESTAVSSLLARAEAEGRIDDVEDQLFRFERIVAGDTALRDALSSRNTDGEGKAGVVATLLEGKGAPRNGPARPAGRAGSRGRRLDRVLAAYLDLAAKRRDELTALVTVASALTEQQATDCAPSWRRCTASRSRHADRRRPSRPRRHPRPGRRRGHGRHHQPRIDQAADT